MIGDCLNCGHPIGYHHGGSEPEMFCTVAGCTCTGYRDDQIQSPQTGPAVTGEEG